MELASQVLILDEAISIHFRTNAIREGMNPPILTSALGK